VALGFDIWQREADHSLPAAKILKCVDSCPHIPFMLLWHGVQTHFINEKNCPFSFSSKEILKP
jgi:hypothetical protein